MVMSPQKTARLTIDEGRDWVDDNLLEGEDVICPCCDQNAKIYRRQIHSGMARELILLYNRAGTRWVRLPEVMSDHRGGDIAKLRYWGLMEQEEGVRTDGSPRTGVWKVTKNGALFVMNDLMVPKYALVYNGELIALDGPEVSILNTLGKKFSYRELMAA